MYIIGILIIFSASLIQGMASFGFSLIAVPLLSLIMDLKKVVSILVIYSLIQNIIIFIQLRKNPDIKAIWPLLVTAVLAIPLGAKLLLVIDEKTLKLVIGFIVIIAALFLFKDIKIKIQNKKLQYVIVGFLSGTLHGSVSLSGPPIILMLANAETDKTTFRSSLAFIFCIMGFTTLPIFYFNNLITFETLKYSINFSPALFLGTLSGITIGNKINERLFAKLTTVLIGLMGLTSILTSI